MRKIVLFIAALLFMAVPVMAVPSNVTITCTPGTGADANWITVSYASDHNRIRAFGLDITTDVNRINQVVVLDPCGTKYRIYPGQIGIVNGEVTDYNKPYASGDINDANVAIEMGSLYTTDPCYAPGKPLYDPNMGYNMIPGLSGDLLKFKIDVNACTYTVDVNVRRGGIVMEDPYEEPNVNNSASPLCTGNICGGLQYYDFGDAPDTYPTLKLTAPGGPYHTMAGATTGIGPILGTNIDAEADGQPGPPICLLDDTTGPTAFPPGDEDGITALVAVVGSPGSVTVTVSQAPGYLNGWIDFNNDGDFSDDGEHVIIDVLVPVSPPPTVLPFAIPAGAVKNTPLVSRWRITSYTIPDVNYYGAATDGEVEDYNKPIIECNEPNVMHLAEAAATTAIQNAGFVCVSNYVNGGAEPIGQVVSQSPPPGAQTCGLTVTINVSAECMKPTTTPASIRTDWVNPIWGKPRCWCYERNCRGDSDGIKTLGNWVALADLNLLKLAYGKADAILQTVVLNGVPGICCDFDHIKTLGNRVALADLNTLKAYYGKAEASVPVCDLSPNYYFWCTPPATCPANFP